MVRCDWRHCRRSTATAGPRRLFSQPATSLWPGTRLAAFSLAWYRYRSERLRHQGRQDNEITCRPSHAFNRPSVRLPALLHDWAVCPSRTADCVMHAWRSSRQDARRASVVRSSSTSPHSTQWLNIGSSSSSTQRRVTIDDYSNWRRSVTNCSA